MPKSIDDLDADSRDSLMILAYLIIQLQQMNWTADRLADRISGHEGFAPPDDPESDDLTAVMETIAESEGLLTSMTRVQVLRRALLVWASRWEDGDEGPLMNDVRTLAQAMLEDDERKSMRSLFTLIKGGRD